MDHHLLLEALLALAVIVCSVTTLLLFPGIGTPWAPPPNLDPLRRLQTEHAHLREAVNRLPVILFIVDRDLLVLDGMGGALPVEPYNRDTLRGSRLTAHVGNPVLLDLYRSAIQGQSRVARFTSRHSPFHSFIAASAPTGDGGAIVWAVDTSALQDDADLQDIISRLRSNAKTED